MEKITVSATINASIKKTWDYYNIPKHIVKWNFADPSWHCPSVSNDMKIGGTFKARMEAKDGSFGFDIEAIYSQIEEYKNFAYEFGERVVSVDFKDLSNQTDIFVTFDAEKDNSVEMQKSGWQAILNNFKNYTETN